MSKLLLENIDENRGEWLRLRSSTVGSSDIPTILGFNKFKTPYQLYKEKRGEAPPVEISEPMEIGTALEPVIGRMFERRMEGQGIMVKPSKCLYRHSEVEWATASPDFDVFSGMMEDAPHGCKAEQFYTDVGILETKYSHYSRSMDWADGQIPLYALLQHAWQLGITGRKWGYVAGFVGDFYMSERLEFDAESFAGMMNAAEQFMWCVKNGKEPTAIASDLKLMERSIKRQKGLEVDLTEHPEVEAATLRFVRANKERKELEAKAEMLEAEEKTAKVRILQLMGEATIATVGGFRITATPVSCKEKVVPAYSYTRFGVKEVA